jgi:hypothetical protein
VRFVTVRLAGRIEIASMRNRIPFLRRVMDEVTRQPPAVGMELDAGADAAEGAFPASGATPLQPLQLFIDLDTLRTLVADAMEALRWSEQRLCTSPERTAAWERAVEQRRRFLAWLATQNGPRVFLAMYPEYLLRGETDADDTPDEQLT